MLSIRVNNKCEECEHSGICKWEDTFAKNLETISVSVEEIPPSPLILLASCEYFMRKTITTRSINNLSDSSVTLTDYSVQIK